ncbi:hypothetical protein GPECTOR_44g22 [Gonium pectorale]|uniref:Uncharacterized protein n=1 Tax=Gonium pectorale TaxID=33097 RepID=A0A150G9A7_GONPE|nr:hypothetical protein GPECTOR_44g22 [Gonium pectorale]|eukprot:KXZ46343.1 hypothetical protein GPECTOR_44g22 [Gonium pectorale]
MRSGGLVAARGGQTEEFQAGLPSPQHRLRRLASSLMGAFRPESAGRHRTSAAGAAAATPAAEPAAAPPSGVSITVRPAPPSPRVGALRPTPPSPRASGGGGLYGGTGGDTEDGSRSIGFSRQPQDLPAAPSPSHSRSLAASASVSIGASGGSVSGRLSGSGPGSAPEGSARRVGWRSSMDGPLTPPSGGPVGISRAADAIPPAPSPSQARSLRGSNDKFHSFHATSSGTRAAGTAAAAAAAAPAEPGLSHISVPTFSSDGGETGGGGVGSKVYSPTPPSAPAPPAHHSSQRGRGLGDVQPMDGLEEDLVEDLEAY